MVRNNQPRDPSSFDRLLAGGVWLISAAAGLFAWIRGKPRPIGQLKHDDVDFEESDISIRSVLLVGFGILVVVWVLTAALYPLFTHFASLRAQESPPRLPVAAHGRPVPPAPRLEESPSRDLQQAKAQAEYALHHYTWIDRSHGIVAIPIDRAMDLVAQRGIPPQTAPPNMFFEPRVGSRLTGLEGKVEPKIQ